MFMSSKHACAMGKAAFHKEEHPNPFPFGITYHDDWLFGYNMGETMEEWYAESDESEEEEWEVDYLDWESEPDEIDANDFHIPDKRTAVRTIYYD